MKITSMDRAACRRIREKMDEALAALGEELGIKFTAGAGSFDEGQVTMKVECAIINEDGQVQSKLASDFAIYAHRHGLPEDSVGKSFVTHSGRFVIKGYKPRATRTPIIADRNGKSYRFTIDAVRRGLEKVRSAVSA